MPWATAHTVSLEGATGHVIDVQVDVSHGLVATALVGRPDISISEARDRCRAAVQNCQLDWPVTKRVTILLSPADLPKRGPHFDLAMALGVLSATGVVPKDALDGVVLIGELTLDGRIRAVPGVLPMVMAAAKRGMRSVVVPEPQADEAAMVPGMTVFGVRSLPQVVALLTGAEEIPDAPEVPPLSGQPLLSWRGEERLGDVDLGDVRGMADARFAIEVAAAGGHHLLLSGPKGSGKTTLAERLPGLLPDLSLEESLEITAIHSLAGTFPPGAQMIVRPPFSAPHHSATRASLLGGGSGRVRPGEISKAHLGVLFLDEFPLFASDIIDAMRQPLESGDITIARGEEVAMFPARAMVVLACNPCPCGNYHPLNRDHTCTCPELKRRTYRNRLSDMIADRIDITRHVDPVPEHEFKDRLTVPEPTAEVRGRVLVARSRQAARYLETHWRLNCDVPGPALRERWPLTDEAERRLDSEIYSGRLTQRGAVRVHRLAWTVSDLRGIDRPGLAELDVALRLRAGKPLELRTLALASGS